jgi:ribosomal protein L11
MEFGKQFNARTQELAKYAQYKTVYKDKSFEFVVKKPACSCSVNGSCEAKICLRA